MRLVHHRVLIYKKTKRYELSVVRGEPGVQGVDDGEDWRLHSLLPDAHRALHRQVRTRFENIKMTI